MGRIRFKKIIGGCSFVVILSIGSLFVPLPKEDFSKHSVQSIRVLDRNGVILREFLNDREGRGIWKSLDEISPYARTAAIAIEDKRFYTHSGIDPISIGRAVVENLRSFRFKSGGSTITQQVVRNVYHFPRTLPYKVVEMWYALRLERMMTKEEIIEQYLNRVPFGNQLFGIEAASRWYFEKPARALSPAEAAFLLALPNSPSLLNPHKNAEAASDRQHTVLNRMIGQNMLSSEEYERALAQPIQVISPESHFKAPHAVEMAIATQSDTNNRMIVTTIDYSLHEQIRRMVNAHLKKLQSKNVNNAAAIVIDNATMEIRVLVGSADFFDEKNEGEVNGATALRQPGSAIKAFTYALALEHGLTPATIIPDIPTAIPDHHGDYVPENYDKHYHGPVRARTALACSYNVPAVRVLQMVGKSALLNKLRDVGCSSLKNDAEFYGYGLTLGNAEVSLLQLTTAYASFANKGIWKSFSLFVQKDSLTESKRVFDEKTAFILADMLNDPAARRPAFGGNFRFPFQCAVKTGTTKDYKDNWTVGFTTRYTVGVWVGNFNGKEMRRVSGVSGAGPIFTDIMMFLHTPPFGQAPDDFEIPNGVKRHEICARSGKLPTILCPKTIRDWFVKENVPKEKCNIHKEYFVKNGRNETVRQVFEVFPREYQQWMINEGIPNPPVDAVPVSTKRIDTHFKLAITSPNNGDLFAVDPVLRSEFQTITISGFIPEKIQDVKLKVNDCTEIPFSSQGVQWKLEKGTFRFQLVATKNNSRIASNSVFITVE